MKVQITSECFVNGIARKVGEVVDVSPESRHMLIHQNQAVDALEADEGAEKDDEAGGESGNTMTKQQKAAAKKGAAEKKKTEAEVKKAEEEKAAAAQAEASK